MPTSANVFPCSNLSSSGLYMTGKLVPVTVLMISALASSLLTGLAAAGTMTFGSSTSASALEVGTQLAHQVGDEAAAELLDVERRPLANIPVHRRWHRAVRGCRRG